MQTRLKVAQFNEIIKLGLPLGTNLFHKFPEMKHLFLQHELDPVYRVNMEATGARTCHFGLAVLHRSMKPLRLVSLQFFLRFKHRNSFKLLTANAERIVKRGCGSFFEAKFTLD
jgi:hypothetical protein